MGGCKKNGECFAKNMKAEHGKEWKAVAGLMCDVDSGHCVCKDGAFDADGDAFNGCESDKPADEDNDVEDGDDNDNDADDHDHDDHDHDDETDEEDDEQDEDDVEKTSKEECEAICMEYCAAEDDDEDDDDEVDDDEDDVEDDEDDKCDPSKEDCKPDEDGEKPDEDDEKPDEEDEKEAFDPSICPEEKYPVSWNKAQKQMKQMFTSADSKFYMVNIQTKQFQEAKPTEEPYTGFLMFAQKYCGADFINKMNEGDVTVDFYDQSDLLMPLAVFKRDDDNKSATVQFKVNKENGGQDEGNKNMDKFYLSINGFGDVEWGKKTFDDCINNMQIGATGGDYEGDLGCIAFAKTIR